MTVLGPDHIDFAIHTDDGKIEYAQGQGLSIAVMPDSPDCHIAHRRRLSIAMGPDGAVNGGGSGPKASMLVCTLAGIKLYVRQISPGNYSMVMTSQKVRP